MSNVHKQNTMCFVYQSALAQLDGATRFSTLPLGRSLAPRPQTFTGALPADAGIWSPHEAVQQALTASVGNTIEGVRPPELEYQGSNVLSYLLHNVQLFQDEPGTGPTIKLNKLNTPGRAADGTVLDIAIDRDPLVLGGDGADLFWSGCRILTPNTQLVFSGDGIAASVLILLEIIPIYDPGTFTDICIALASGGVN